MIVYAVEYLDDCFWCVRDIFDSEEKAEKYISDHKGDGQIYQVTDYEVK